MPNLLTSYDDGYGCERITNMSEDTYLKGGRIELQAIN